MRSIGWVGWCPQEDKPASWVIMPSKVIAERGERGRKIEAREVFVKDTVNLAAQIEVLGQDSLLPRCANHKPVQHRDGKPPWCKACGRP